MQDIFARIILGHLFGDYLFQGRTMALRKTEKGWKGVAWCTLHSIIYTICVCLFLWTINPVIIALVFISHWPIDRWSVGSLWLKMIQGCSFVEAFFSKEEYRDIDLAFSCYVYAVVDNTLHLFLLWAITKLPIM